MSLDTFDKAGSVPRTVTLTDGADPIDTSNFDTIEVKVFNFIHRIIGTYSLVYGTVTKVAPTSSGNIFFVVPAATTAISRALKYFYRVKTTEVDPTYPTGIRTRSFTSWGFDLKVTR